MRSSAVLKVPVGTVRELPTKTLAWKEVERQQLQINEPDFRQRITFADLAQHYQQHELSERRSASVDPKAYTTVAAYKRVLQNRLLPRWGKRIALAIQPLEVEEWLSAVKEEEALENPTLDKMRRVMSLVYKHSQGFGLIPRREECNPLRFVRYKTLSGLSPAGSRKSGSDRQGRSMSLWIPQPAALAGIDSGPDKNGPEDCASLTPAFGREDHAATLRTQRERGSDDGAG